MRFAVLLLEREKGRALLDHSSAVPVQEQRKMLHLDVLEFQMWLQITLKCASGSS